MSTVTMQELELEHAELLPARETLVVGIDPAGPIRYPGPVYPDPGGPGPPLSGGSRPPLSGGSRPPLSSGSRPRLG
jgi:hypothetical protein